MADLDELKGSLEYKVDELIDSLSSIAESLRDLGPLSIPAPEVKVEAAQVSVAAPTVKPQINVNVPPDSRPRKWEFTVHRDHLGYISTITAQASAS